jgi:4-amino-4-deoxy-L-arabinose transferase-like glycosyltransferase
VVPETRDRRGRLWLAGILILALGLRMGFVYVQTQHQLFAVATVAPDSARYLSLAKSLLQGEGFSYGGGEPTAADPPGYPLLLAGLRAAFGPGLLPIYLAQALLSTATVWLVAALARRLFGPGAGLAAGLLAALDPLLFVFVATPLTETLYTFLAALFLLLAARAGGRPGAGLAAGLAAGTAALTRPVVAGFVPALVGWRLLRPRTRAAALALGLGFCLLLAPWAARNWVALGEFVPLTTRAGLEFYGGNAPDSTGGSGGHLSWGVDVDRPPPPPPGAGEAERSRRLMGLALEGLAENPALVWQRLPAKVWNLWRPVWEGASLKNRLAVGGAYLAAWAGALLCLLSPGGARRGALLWGFLLYHAAVHAVVYGIIRHRIPLEPALIALAGGGWAWLWARLAGRRPEAPA